MGIGMGFGFWLGLGLGLGLCLGLGLECVNLQRDTGFSDTDWETVGL